MKVQIIAADKIKMCQLILKTISFAEATFICRYRTVIKVNCGNHMLQDGAIYRHQRPGIQSYS